MLLFEEVYAIFFFFTSNTDDLQYYNVTGTQYNDS